MSEAQMPVEEVKKVEEGAAVNVTEESGDAGTGSGAVANSGEAETVEVLDYATFKSEAITSLKIFDDFLKEVELPLDQKSREFAIKLVEKIDFLLGQNLSEQDAEEGLYPKLLELRIEIMELRTKNAVLKFESITQELSTPPTSQELEDLSLEISRAFSEDFEISQELIPFFLKMLKQEASLPEETEAVSDKVSKARRFGRVAMSLVGESLLDLFYDKEGLDLAAFISFITNPTGALAEAHLRKKMEEGLTEIPHHVFVEKFRNYKEVGEVLFDTSEELENEEGFTSWKEANRSELSDIREKANSVVTANLLLDLYEKVLKKDEDKFKLFANTFVSKLYGKDDLTVKQDSIDFLKGLFENEGRKLKEYWHIGNSSKDDEDKVS